MSHFFYLLKARSQPEGPNNVMKGWQYIYWRPPGGCSFCIDRLLFATHFWLIAHYNNR